MQRFKIEVLVNNKPVPNTIVFDDKSAIMIGSEEFRRELVMMLLGPEQNITSVDWKVVPIEDVEEKPAEEEKPDGNRPLDQATLDLFR